MPRPILFVRIVIAFKKNLDWLEIYLTMDEEQLTVDINELRKQALAYYHNSCLQQSLEIWQDILQLDTGNVIAQIYSRRIRRQIDEQGDAAIKISLADSTRKIG